MRFGWLPSDIQDTPDALGRLRAALAEAECVVIGAGAGLSASAGYDYNGARFDCYMGDLGAKYGYHDMYMGGFYSYETLEEMWAFWSRNIFLNRYIAPPKPVYEQLLALVRGRDYFVVTTNVDHCFQRAGFAKERLYYTQGDYGLWQCSKPCHKKTYDNEETVRQMIAAQGFVIRDTTDEDHVKLAPLVPASAVSLELPGGAKDAAEAADAGLLRSVVPSELIPHCPVCGRPMNMNLRADVTFVEDAGWHAAAERYGEFLETHKEKKMLLLELGVGGNTPGIIKYPFWRMTKDWPHVTYASVNRGEAFVPDEIREKSICINRDIQDVIQHIK